MTRSEIIANHIAELRHHIDVGFHSLANREFTHAIYAALAPPGCEAQGVRLVDLPRLAERVAEMADAHERVVGERDAARTLLNLVSEALSGGEAPVDRLPELVFAMGQRFAAAVDARDAARAEVAKIRDLLDAHLNGWAEATTPHPDQPEMGPMPTLTDGVARALEDLTLARAEVVALRAQVAEAEQRAERERADVVAWLRGGGWLPAKTWESVRNCFHQAADIIGRGEHEGAATPK